MIALASFKTQLEAQLVPGTLKSVGYAADLIAALDQLKAAPAAFVLMSRDTAGTNTAGALVIRQPVVQTVSVIVGFLLTGAAGGSQTDAIETMRDALNDALVGQQFDGAAGLVEYAGGRMVSFDPQSGALFWGSDFRVPTYLRM